jgi:AhpC/TSA family
MSLSGRRPLLAVLALVAVTVACREEQPRVEVETGMPAPALTGSAVRGGEVSLQDLRGRIVLVSFLNSRAEATAEGDPSRAQIVFLRSMETQHERLGLRVIVVDAAELAGAGRPSRNDLVNYTYDWNLDSAIAVLRDDATLAHRFGVAMAPTTFLIGPEGVVRKRWDGFAPAAQLDLSIRMLEGRSPTD